MFGRLRIESGEQRSGIHGVNHAHESDDVLYLVSLKVTYQMPLYVVGKHRMLVAHLLRTVLPENTLARIVCLAHRLGGVGLGYCDKGYALGQRFSKRSYLVCYRHV